MRTSSQGKLRDSFSWDFSVKNNKNFDKKNKGKQKQKQFFCTQQDFCFLLLSISSLLTFNISLDSLSISQAVTCSQQWQKADGQLSLLSVRLLGHSRKYFYRSLFFVTYYDVPRQVDAIRHGADLFEGVEHGPVRAAHGSPVLVLRVPKFIKAGSSCSLWR